MKNEKAIEKSIHAPHVNRTGNDLAGWSELIRKQGEESRARQEGLNARHDKIIAELENADSNWWVHYPMASSIMVARLHLLESGGEHAKRIEFEIVKLERDIVAAYIIPAVFAAVRAGFVKYEEQK